MLMAYSSGRCNESQDKCRKAKVSVEGLDLWTCTGIDSWQLKGLRDLLSGSTSACCFSFRAQTVSPRSTKDDGALIMTLDDTSKQRGFVRRQAVW